MSSLCFTSPAKVNRFLHIVGRRDDGYHLLQTLFQYLDYGDELSFELRQDNKICLSPQTHNGILEQDNLIYKAALALQSASQCQQGANIHWIKRLPLGSGLGGGSSNAATCLYALNLIWQLNWSKSALMDLGLRLGADVPFFLFGHTALGEGIGEKLSAVELPTVWFLVITPPCLVSTPKMYAHPQLTRNSPTLRIEALAKDGLENTLSQCRNDFEALVRQCYPDVDNALKWLSNYGEARLSGSGASVFACFSTQEQAQRVAEQLPPNLKGFVAKGMNTSPLNWGVAKW